ncbi:MAG TPA: magnesium and cobalt transport protein CorA [Candidatus Magasanikbacteria bacterium]|nr:MAG: magnesium and cobalt transport protein CorA [Candidatus Magasanikbacteria bacterium RIFOXYC2_FULL_39_8]HAT03299.1 magnesium and cobalt transport protein CorA [Candidatus Magasanikbacteria bacterium]
MPVKHTASKDHIILEKDQISIFDYNKDKFEEKDTGSLSDCIQYKNTPSVTWVNIDRVPPADFLKKLGLGFELHPIILEDIENLNQRPKVEFMDDYIYTSVKMLNPDPKTKKIQSEQVSIITAPKFVLTFQEGIKGDTFEPVRELIRKSHTRIRTLDTDYLLYELIDSIVNKYFSVLETFGERIETLENEVVKTPNPKTLKSIHTLKRDILHVRKSVWPLREVVSMLERSETMLIKKNTRIYFRDIYERLIQIIDSLETYRDILSGLLDVYLSSINNRLNSVMKILTIITTIFMPLSFLTGLYGMNFVYMPGLHSIWGFPIMLGAMSSVFIVMMIFFNKKKWL